MRWALEWMQDLGLGDLITRRSEYLLVQGLPSYAETIIKNPEAVGDFVELGGLS